MRSSHKNEPRSFANCGLKTSKNLNAISKIKLPNFMMTLAEFKSRTAVRNSLPHTNSMVASSSISTIYGSTGCHAKVKPKAGRDVPTSKRDGNQLSLYRTWENYRDKGKTYEKSVPYFKHTKSILDLNKHQDELGDETYLIRTSLLRSLADQLTAKQQFYKSETELCHDEVPRFGNVGLLASKTRTKYNDYKQKIRNTISSRNANCLSDEDTCESTPIFSWKKSKKLK